MNRIEYLFQCLGEELAEAVQAASKCNRFRPEDRYAGLPAPRIMLIRELNDVLGVVEKLKEEGIELSGVGDPYQIKQKAIKLELMIRYSEEVGALKDSELQRQIDIRQAQLNTIIERKSKVDGENITLQAEVDRLRKQLEEK